VARDTDQGAARHGTIRPAESLARQAVEFAAATDDLNLPADKLMDLVEVVGLAGRREAAAALVAEALKLYEAKGNLVSSRQATGIRARLED
jgi:hypothetical protein